MTKRMFSLSVQLQAMCWRVPSLTPYQQTGASAPICSPHVVLSIVLLSLVGLRPYLWSSVREVFSMRGVRGIRSVRRRPRHP